MHATIELDSISLSPPRRTHLIGIAGNGMRALADVLIGWGWPVSGSDLDPSPVKHLLGAGIGLFQGHSPDNLPPDAELVVYSDAVPPDNSELRRAAERGIPALSYFQMLGRLGLGKNLSAVAGTHGKSTVTAMTAHLLVRAGLDPTVVCGAAPLGASSGGRAGSGNLILVEACEYRANFLHLQPRQAVILGIEPDHFDCYGSLDELEAAFARFAASLPADGLLLARHERRTLMPLHNSRGLTAPGEKIRDLDAFRGLLAPGYYDVDKLCSNVKCRVETFGLSPGADWSAAGIKPRPAIAPGTPQQSGATAGRGFIGRYQFEIWCRGRRFCEVGLQVPGRHNVLNALAAAALAHANGVSVREIAAGLGDFSGLRRRMELLGERRGVAFIDDYAHHPAEVRAALAAARAMFPGRRLWCVFQPHQASRTARLLDELAESLQNADKVLVAGIFYAREDRSRDWGVTSRDLAQKAAAAGAEVLPNRSDCEITEVLETQLAPGDVLITLGAGDVAKLQPNLDCI